MNGLELVERALDLWVANRGSESTYLQCQRFDGFYMQWAWQGNENIVTYASAKLAGDASMMFTTSVNDPTIQPGDLLYWHWNPYGHVCTAVGWDGARLLVSNTAKSGDTVKELRNGVKISHADSIALTFRGASHTNGKNARRTGVTPWPVPALGPQQRQVRADNEARRRIGAASTSAPQGDPLPANTVGNFQGWVYGDAVEGNSLWYVGISGDFFWSGSFTEVSAHDLADMNAKPSGNQRTALSTGAVNQRTSPSVSAPIVQVIAAGATGTFDGWRHGDAVSGNDVWFRGALSGLWSWSGGFTDTGTHDLADLNSTTPPPAVDPDNPRGLAEYAPVLPLAKKGLVAPLGFRGGDFSKPQTRTTKGNPPVDVVPLIDRYIIHHTATAADQLDYFSYMNDRSSCPTWYLRTDGTIFEMIRPQLKPAASGPSWNWRSLATETQNVTGEPSWAVSDAQVEAHAQIVAWIAEHDGKELDGVPVSFKIDREHVIGHSETGFATACPGPYLSARLDAIVARAQAIWDEKHPPVPPSNDVVLTRAFVSAQITALDEQADAIAALGVAVDAARKAWEGLMS